MARSAIYVASGIESLPGAQSAANLFYAVPINNGVIADPRNDTLASSTGSATLSGGAGKNVFEFVKGGNANVLMLDFPSSGKSSLAGDSAEEVQHGFQYARATCEGATVRLSDSTTITFANVADLKKSNFT